MIEFARGKANGERMEDGTLAHNAVPSESRRDLVGCRDGRPVPRWLGAPVELGTWWFAIAWMGRRVHTQPLGLAWNWLNGWPSPVQDARRSRALWRDVNFLLPQRRHQHCLRSNVLSLSRLRCEAGKFVLQSVQRPQRNTDQFVCRFETVVDKHGPGVDKQRQPTSDHCQTRLGSAHKASVA